eukprot:360207-Chlamydomonas_euryale.AAC.15
MGEAHDLHAEVSAVCAAMAPGFCRPSRPVGCVSVHVHGRNLLARMPRGRLLSHPHRTSPDRGPHAGDQPAAAGRRLPAAGQPPGPVFAP